MKYQQSSNFKKKLIVSAVSAAMFGTAMPVFAQDSEVQAEQGLETIVVTARKTVETLQEVPVAVTSVGEAELTEKGISVITEIQQFSPNTTLQASRATNSTLTAFIRGVGQQDPLWGYEPGVGIYVDDVYMARPQGAVLDLLDVERIEVLRGPQGTLYGKNTIGGAVKYVTKEMSGDGELTIQGTVGSYSQKDVKVTGQLPIIDDMLYVGFGYADLNRDGFGEFLESALPNQDKENYNKDLTAARLTLEFRPMDNLFMRLNWDKTEDDSNSKGGYRLLPSIVTEAPVPDSVYDSYTSLPTFTKVELEGLSLVIDWYISEEFGVKYIGSSREGDSPINIDFDNTPIDIFDTPAYYDDENTTHELQARYLGDSFTVVGGLYAYDGESCGRFDANLNFLGRVAFGTEGLTREVNGCNNSTSTAAYVQASVDFTDKLSMTLGGRYTNEEKEAWVSNGLIFAPVYPSDDWIPGYDRPGDGATGIGVDDLVPMVLGTDTDGDGIIDAPKSEDWTRFTPRVGVEYQMSDDIMFFASYSQGFKSGTFNPRASINEVAADPEIVDSYEIGMKSDWFDRLRANITIFALEHKDRQYVDYIPGEESTDLVQNLSNVGNSTGQGIEAELSFIATENLTFDVAIGTYDGDFEDVIATQPDGSQLDISDTFSISNTPDLTATFAANYLLETEFGDFTFNGTYYHRGEYKLFETSDLLVQDSVGLVNFSIAWESTEGNWFGGIHAKNVTDEEYLVGGYDFVGVDPVTGEYSPGLGGDLTLIGYYGDPATYHLTIGYRL